jgi:hypothetical protein
MLFMPSQNTLFMPSENTLFMPSQNNLCMLSQNTLFMLFMPSQNTLLPSQNTLLPSQNTLPMPSQNTLFWRISIFYRNATVDLTHIDTPPNMSAWPQFHNGVSAGLRMANSSQVCKILGILIHTCTKFSETVNLNCF